MTLAAPYVLSLCDLAKTSNVSFGIAKRLYTRTTSFLIEAAPVIHSVVTFSPASESVAIEFLHEFQKSSTIKELVTPVLLLKSELGPEEWAKEVIALMRSIESKKLESELIPVLSLAMEYINPLLIATRNPGEQKAPQVPTPDDIHSRSIEELLKEALTTRRQPPLRELILRRDGYNCLFTANPFQQESGPGLIPRTTHIIPFYFTEKTITRHMLDTFTAHGITAEIVQTRINDPCNAFNAEPTAHEAFDRLAWGIEAQQQPGGKWKYFYRRVRERHPFTVRLRDGDEILFGSGQDGQTINAPDPFFCNVRLALARAAHACEASALVDELCGSHNDEESITS